MYNYYFNKKTNELKKYLLNCILPVKYAYTLSAANYHIAYAKSQDYHSTVGIEKTKYEFLIKYLNNNDYDYCEIGCDDGETSLSIIDYFIKNGILFNQHIFIDFSHELLNKCKSRIDSFASHLNCKFIQHDIERTDELFSINSRKKIIFFLGNTLGNVESENDVLQNIYNFMNKDDLFLIGLTLKNKHFDELSGYNNETFRESVLEFLRIIGIKSVPENYILRYDSINQIVICEYQLPEPFCFQELKFNQGYKIRCFQSRRYTLDDCNLLFKENKFSILETIIDKELRHVLFLLKR